MPIERREITNRPEWLEWRQEDLMTASVASIAACLWGDDIHPYTTAYLAVGDQKRPRLQARHH